VIQAEGVEVFGVMLEPFDGGGGVETLAKQGGGIGEQQGRQLMLSALFSPGIGQARESACEVVEIGFD